MGSRTTRVSKSQNRGDGAHWSDLNHDVLSIVMMKLEAPDFTPFSGVCKSWRSLALPNKSSFMASRPPMCIQISNQAHFMDEYSLEDFGGKMFNIQLPISGGRYCVGLTCGYLVLFRTKHFDLMLINPITRHAIRFPTLPANFNPFRDLRALLVFSPSISAWVLLVICRCTSDIWFSIMGKEGWEYHVSSKSCIIDLHEFKGKIYVMGSESRLYELGLHPKPKLKLLKTNNILGPDVMFFEFVSSGENLYALECLFQDLYVYGYKVHKLDFSEMKWVPPEENTLEGYACFVSPLKHGAVIKPSSQSESDSLLRYKYKRFAVSAANGNDMFFRADKLWYFPQDCLKVNFKHK